LKLLKLKILGAVCLFDVIASSRAADDLLCNGHSSQSDVYSYHWNTNCRQSCHRVSPYIGAIIPNASRPLFAISFGINLHLLPLVLHNFHFSVTDTLFVTFTCPCIVI
jgi:hypothetical protein